MSQRGYAQFVAVQVEPAVAWSACTEERWLRQWYATDARVDPRRGGMFRVKLKDGRVRDATIDVWDPPKRLRLIYSPDADMLALHGEGVGPIVEDLLIDAKPEHTVVRVFGSGVPDMREWDGWYSKMRLGWAYWLHQMKRALEGGASAGPAGASSARAAGTKDRP